MLQICSFKKMQSGSFTVILLIIFLIIFSIKAKILVEDDFSSGDLSKRGPDGFKWTDKTYTQVTNKVGYGSSNGLVFQYPNTSYWSEQRFSLNMSYPEIWVQYFIRVPVNYFHAKVNPSNRKFFALWMDDYSSKGDGPTVVWEFW